MVPTRAWIVIGTFLQILIAGAANAVSSEPISAKHDQGKRPVRVDAQGDPLPVGATARLGTFRFRIRNKGALVNFAPDGKSLVFHNEEGLSYWDLHTDRLVHKTPLKEANFFSHTDDGRKGVFNTTNGLILVDLATGKVVGQVPKSELQFRAGKAEVQFGGASFLSRDGQFWGGCFVDGDDGSYIVWFNTATGKRLHCTEIKPGAHQPLLVTFTPDAKAIVIPKQIEKANVWLQFFDVASGKERIRLKVPVNDITALTFVGDGSSFLISSEGSKGVRLFDAASGMERRCFPAKDGKIEAFLVSHDGKMLYIVSACCIRQWDLARGRDVRLIRLTSHEEETPRVLLSPDGKWLIACGGHHWTLWDTTTGRPIQPTGGHTGPVDSVSFSPRGDRLLTIGLPAVGLVWQLPTLKEVRRLRPLGTIPAGHDPAAFAHGSFSSDGKLLVAVWPGFPVHLWDAEVVKTPTRLGEGVQPQALAVGAGGKLVAGLCQDGKTLLWDAANGKELHQFIWENLPAKPEELVSPSSTSIALSPDGKLLAGGGFQNAATAVKRTVRLWETSSGALRNHIEFFKETPVGEGTLIINADAPRRTVQNVPVYVQFSPDVKRMALGGPGLICLWDLHRDKEIRHFAWAAVHTRSMAFSPDGKLLAAGGVNGSIRVWEVETGTIFGETSGHQAAVTSLAFAADGRQLASASMDTTVLLWDVKTLLEEAKGTPSKPGPGQIEALWQDLAGADAAKAFQAIHALAAMPREAVALLKEKLRPVVAVEPGRLKQLLADLGDRHFAVRDRAMQALEDMDALARPALREFVEGPISPEARKRAEQLLARLDGPVVNSRLLVALRGIEVLEHIGSPEATRVLQSLAGGAPGHRLTLEARASLGRLGERKK
jgi:WD40 repeat protein